MSCRAIGLVSKNTSLRQQDSSGIDERKKGHFREGAMYLARQTAKQSVDKEPHEEPHQEPDVMR